MPRRRITESHPQSIPQLTKKLAALHRALAGAEALIMRDVATPHQGGASSEALEALENQIREFIGSLSKLREQAAVASSVLQRQQALEEEIATLKKQVKSSGGGGGNDPGKRKDVQAMQAGM